MKKTILKLASACLAFATVSGLALAQVNQLSDPGFELELGQKLTNFNNAAAAGFWLDDGVTYTNTGYESVGAHSGVERAYEMSGDGGAFQISGYTMNNGDQLTLTWWATVTSDPSPGNTNPPEQVVGLISCPSQYPANGPAGFTTCTPLAVTNNGLTGAYIQYTLNYTAGPGDVGKYVGCYFDTTNAYGLVSNSFSGFDDFYLAVLPAGSKPGITVEPASQTAYTGANITFAVSAVGATSYQWMGGATGSGIYTNLLNAGQFSGVTTPNMTVSNVQPTNSGDYIVVVSNGNGSVTSAPPANLTVASIIYQENFNLPTSPNASVNEVGWMNDINGNFGGRDFANPSTGVTFPNMAVYSYDAGAAIEAFYGTTRSINGGPYPASPNPITNHMAFPGINLQVVQNVSFAVDLDGPYNGTSTHSYICVQMNSANWYVATNELLPQPNGSPFVTHSLRFNPAASGWDNLTVSGTGSDTMTLIPVVGSVATANLTGYITGIGIVCVHSGGSTVQFDNYTVLGAIPPTPFPVINSPPSSRTNYTGTTATFSVSATTNSSTAGLTYLWEDGTVGSGIYAPLSNGGQFSGVTSATLTISNVTSAANHKDYVVIVTDGAGSVTSTPPATLTVQDSVPILTTDTAIYPNNGPLFSTTNITIDAGNNNIMNLTAAFKGTLPISYQWQISATNDGTGVTSVSGATNSSLTLPNPQTGVSGYYRLSAVNSQGGPVTSDWVQLTVLSATNNYIQWSPAITINGLTASQVLGGTPGAFFEAETFGGTALSVTNGTNVFVFDNTGVAASSAISGTAFTGVYTGPSTGDTNLDVILNADIEAGSTLVTVKNLTVSNQYSVQLFALNDVAGVTRQANWSDANNAADVSQTFTMGGNVYVVGTFTATNTTAVINENCANNNGYISAVIVRTVPPAPMISIQKVGSNVQVTYSNGILEQATSVKGPWTTNNTASPYIFTPNGTSQFFRAQSP